MNRFKNIITAIVARGLCLLATGVAITSCSTIFTDMSDCPLGLSLHFKYDYNMANANSLHKKNDCMTVCVYDSEGNIVTTKTESGDVLADEDYHMDIEVPEGDYEIDVLLDDWTAVTVDGGLSAHYENTVLITDGEPELLTL